MNSPCYNCDRSSWLSSKEYFQELSNQLIEFLDITEDKPVLCLDGDNFYNTDIIKLWNGSNGIVTFEDHNNDAIYSYIELEKQNRINIKEKDKIYFDRRAGFDIELNDKVYQVIKEQDIVIVI